MILARPRFKASIGNQNTITGQVVSLVNARLWVNGSTETIPDEMGSYSWGRTSGLWGYMGGKVSGAPIDAPCSGMGYINATGGGRFSGSWADSSLNFSSNDFTIDFWMYHVTTPNAFILGRLPNVSIHPWTVWINGSNQLLLSASQSGASYDFADQALIHNAPALNTWHYYRISRVGNYLYLFANGTLTTTVDVTGKVLWHNNQGMYLGYTGSNCYIAGFRLISGQGLSSSSFSVPTRMFENPYLGNQNATGSQVLTLLNFNGTNGSTTFTESAPTPTLTWSAVNGTALSTTQAKFGTASLACTNSGARLQASYNAAMNLTNVDWTMDCWAYPTENTQGFVFDGREVNGTGYGIIIQNLGGTNGSFQFLVPNAGNSAYTVNIYTTPYAHYQLNSWHHLRMCRRGSIVYAFVNGILIGTNFIGTANIYNPASTWKIGGYQSNFYFRGYTDSFRFAKGIGESVRNFVLPTAEYSY